MPIPLFPMLLFSVVDKIIHTRLLSFANIGELILLQIMKLRKFMSVGQKIGLKCTHFGSFVFKCNKNTSNVILELPNKSYAVPATTETFLLKCDKLYNSQLISVPVCVIAPRVTWQSSINLMPPKFSSSPGDTRCFLGEEFLWYDRSCCWFFC
jgi:hypothetical protein